MFVLIINIEQGRYTLHLYVTYLTPKGIILMSTVEQKKTVVGKEAKFITYVTDQNKRPHDLHVIKERVHYSDGTSEAKLRLEEDYIRYFYLTNKGQANHNEKKDYEYLRNLKKFSTTQINMPFAIQKALRDYKTPDGTKLEWSNRPNLRQMARMPYLYGSDVNSTCCIKNEYREAYPDLTPSRNTVGGGDIETNVYQEGKDGEIICMSVTHKENVYLAYLDRWVDDIDDPVKETLEELERLPELVTLKKARNLNIEVEVCNTPAQIVINCIKRLHQWKPDFFAFWNMDFDMSRILKCLEDHGIDPASVFSDPSIPGNYKYFHYKQDQAMSTTASGVTKSKGPEDQWHWVTAPATFQCIDALSTYRVTRLAKGKESSYALDYILKKELSVDDDKEVKSEEVFKDFMKSCKKKIDERIGSHPYWMVSNPVNDEITRTMIPGEEEGTEVEHIERDPVWEEVNELVYGVNVFDGYKVRLVLNFGKLKFPETDHLTGIEWHIEMQKNHKIRYGLYNIIDSIRLEQLDERTNDLARSITLYSKNSDFKNFNSNPKRLCDDMHFWYLKRPDPCVIGSSSDQMIHDLDQYVVGHDGWIVTLPSYMAGPNGIKCVKEFPDYRSLIWTHVADLDIVSTYPNVSQILNIARETVVMEFSALWGISEHHRREVGVNLTGARTNALEIAQKIFKAPKLDTLLEAYLKKRGNKPLTNLVDQQLPK